MDRTIWKKLCASARSLDRSPKGGRWTFTDADIVLTYLWSVAHKRPVSWACRRDAWPLHERHLQRPSPSRMSRRLRTPGVRALLEAVEKELRPTPSQPAVLLLDGKAMRVASHSRDRFARFGAYGLRGYKLHAFCDILGRIVAWRVTPMNCYEPEIARRLVAGLPGHQYLLADSNYHASDLFRACATRGVQLVAPRRTTWRSRGVRKGRIEPARRRSIDLLEAGGQFGPDLYTLRRTIERVFGRLEMNHGIGHPPAHVRGLLRIRQWVHAIVILDLAAARERHSLAA